MNIFIVDESPILAAQSLHDRHVVKMILESCQMLSTACHEVADFANLVESCTQPNKPSLYKPTHVNHPCTIWARSEFANFGWLVIHLNELLSEYHRRFPGKTHACYPMGLLFAEAYARDFNLGKSKHDRVGFFTLNQNGVKIVSPALIEHVMTTHSTFVFAGPDEYRTFYQDERTNDEVIRSYRAYYSATKLVGNRWTNPIYVPDWLERHPNFTRPHSDSSGSCQPPAQAAYHPAESAGA